MIRPTLALLLALAAPAAAQDFIYGLNLHGKLSINGTVLDSLPSSFDADTGQNALEQWLGLAVAGPDRYALRIDGRIFKNGKKEHQLEVGTDGTFVFVWRGFDATVNAVHALRQDGLLNTNGTAVVSYPFGSFAFTQLAARPDAVTDGATDTVFALRSDGSIFSGTSTSAVAKFTASVDPDPPDGTTAGTVWIDVVIDETNAELVALRSDGELWSVDLSEIGALTDGEVPGGSSLASLPFPSSSPSAADFYVATAVADGQWRVLRADGSVFTPESVLDPAVDYAGDGTGDQDFLAMAAKGEDFIAVRDDGLVFKNLEDTDALFNMVGSDYVALKVGDEPPDLTSFKNPQPKGSGYTITVLEGETASIPVVVSDIEKLSDDLVVTVNPDVPLPTGATFLETDDGEGHLTRTIEWDGTQQPVGVYVCKLIVEDGVTKPKKFSTKIKVVAADTDPEKNKGPRPAKIKGLQALVGFEMRIKILATDLDLDPLTITVNPEKYPFTEAGGATYDELTSEFIWTPTFENIGTAHPKFKVSDGIKEKTLSLTVKVKSPLIFDVPPPPPPNP